MEKMIEYGKAMELYLKYPFYNKMWWLTSSLTVSFQILSVYLLFADIVWGFWVLPVIIISFLVTDLVNGAIHMFMDNNTNYTSTTGPFIAAFHLHHKFPKYKNKNILRIYFEETGQKYWLVFYMTGIFLLQINGGISGAIELLLVSFSIFSSFAEVSHFLCHNSRSKSVKMLQKLRILLPYEHHLEHHSRDNMNYAFLNGVSDPILNRVASFWFKGYKHHADLHSKAYKGPVTGNR